MGCEFSQEKHQVQSGTHLGASRMLEESVLRLDMPSQLCEQCNARRQSGNTAVTSISILALSSIKPETSRQLIAG